MDLEARAKVAKLQWIRRLLRTPNINSADSLSTICNTNDIRLLFAYKAKHTFAHQDSVPYYKRMFEFWHDIHAFEPSDENEIRKEILWGNPRITSEGAPFYWPRWESAGIFTVGDICHHREDRLLSHLELENKFGIKCSFLHMLRIRSSIPIAWRRKLSNNWTEPPNLANLASRSGILIALPGEDRIDILNVTPKAMYKALVHGKNHVSTSYLHWLHNQDPSLRIRDPTEWAETTRSVYRATRETKLQTLHFRILNRIVPCNSFLKRIRIKESDSCSHCGDIDSLDHFFFSCPSVALFRQSVFAWLLQVEDLRLDNISAKNFLFGFPPTLPKSRKINAILMSMKFYVYRQRLFHEGKLDLTQWLREFRLRLTAERDICAIQGTNRKFAQWRDIFLRLG